MSNTKDKTIEDLAREIAEDPFRDAPSYRTIPLTASALDRYVTHYYGQRDRKRDDEFTVKDVMKKTGQKRSVVYRNLERDVQDGVLTSRVCGRQKVYSLPQPEDTNGPEVVE